MNLLPCESGALVYDLGSSSIQFGFAGDAQPLFSVPSSGSQCTRDGEEHIGFGNTWLQKQMQGIEILPMIDDRGCLADTGLVCSFFDWTYQSCLSVESTERPVLVTQPSYLSGDAAAFSSWRKGLCEAMFEFAQHPAVCLEHDSVLACFSHAAHTAVVVDFGWAALRVVPIQAGRPLLASMQKETRIGGLGLSNALESDFDREGRRVTTAFDLPSCTVMPRESQRRYCQREVVKDILRSCLTFQPQIDMGVNKFEYYMPGHQLVNVEEKMKLYARSVPVQMLMQAAITNEHTPADVRKQLWGNIVMSGGLSNLPGFGAWLEASQPGTKQAYMPKVMHARHRIVSGSNTVWAGGSILASLDTFQEFCITKQEWEETGENILQSKCC